MDKEILLTGSKWIVKLKQYKTKNRNNKVDYLEIKSENGFVSEYINPAYFIKFLLKNNLSLSKKGVVTANLNFVGFYDKDLGHMGWTYKFEVKKD